VDESYAPGSDGYDDLPGETLTIDQLVAINMRHWRRAAGMTQEELGAMLGWSAANVSAAERSSSRNRDPRRFDAQTLAEIAAALDIPLVALFMPPEGDGQGARYTWQANGETRDMAGLMRVVMHDTFEETALMDDYRARFRLAIGSYIPGQWAEFAASLYAPPDDKEARAEEAARLRSRQAALLRFAAEDGAIAERLEQPQEELS